MQIFLNVYTSRDLLITYYIKHFKKVGYYIMMKFIEKHQLTPVFIRQKSFYHKAWVMTCTNIDGDTVHYLLSYDTIVCAIKNGEFTRFWWDYSRTTINHVNDFCYQYGIATMNKKAWDNLPVKTLNQCEKNALYPNY